MAQRIVLIDDLDQSEPAQTVSFGLEGVQYEIDLGTKNLANLEEALAPYVQAARRVGGRRRQASGTTPVAATGSSTAKRGKAHASDKGAAEERAAIRAWAAENDVAMPERGRIPAAVREQYAAAIAS